MDILIDRHRPGYEWNDSSIRKDKTTQTRNEGLRPRVAENVFDLPILMISISGWLDVCSTLAYENGTFAKLSLDIPAEATS